MDIMKKLVFISLLVILSIKLQANEKMQMQADKQIPVEIQAHANSMRNEIEIKNLKEQVNILIKKVEQLENQKKKGSK